MPFWIAVCSLCFCAWMTLSVVGVVLVLCSSLVPASIRMYTWWHQFFCFSALHHSSSALVSSLSISPLSPKDKVTVILSAATCSFSSLVSHIYISLCTYAQRFLCSITTCSPAPPDLTLCTAVYSVAIVSSVSTLLQSTHAVLFCLCHACLLV